MANELIWISKLDEGYSLDDARSRYEVRDLPGKGYLVLNWDAERFWLKFAVLSFLSSSGDDTEVEMDLQFHGEGPTGNLRECRHTYWGDGGYIFYPSGKVISAGLEALSEFFDDLK